MAAACLFLLPLAGFGLGAASADAQARTLQDAALPRPGELWVEIVPSLENWNSVFAADRPEDPVEAGDRVPLYRDLEGRIEDRLYPGVEPFLAEMNLDAQALGYDPLSPGEFSPGALEFGTVGVQRRRVGLGLELGLLSPLSLDVRAPLAYTETEAHFAFDPAGATVVAGGGALEDPAAVIQQMQSARDELEAMLAGGEIPPQQEAQAQALLESSGIFLEALQRRIAHNRLLPLAGTPAGSQLAGRYGGLDQDFTEFGLELPELGLREAATAEDVAAFFAAPPLFGALATGRVRRGWTVPEVEAGMRLRLTDAFGDPDALLRHRTAVGARLRVPLGDLDEPPFHDADAFLGEPVGSGHRALELAGYADLAVGDRILMNLSVRYGVQAAAELTLRVHPPDRPFAVAEARTRLRREPGDYLLLRAAPQLRLGETVSVGAEYGRSHRASDRFFIVEPDGPGERATPLELETSATVHRLGLVVQYRTGRAAPAPRDPDAPVPRDPDRRPDAAGAPWQLGFVLQGALAGSGGRAPASQRLLVSLRAPLGLF